MARLNESTVSAEPIEILKRRFVRQNREIARVNSIQSLRIRSLESEVSHLLSENVSLREQVIFLTQELERFEAAKTLHDGVYDVKVRLDSKLLELTSLISELGALPRRYSRMTRESDESESNRQPRGSSTAKLVNDADAGPGLESEYDGRLPVILEDKYYPRHTLSAHEIQGLSNSNADMLDSSGLEGSGESLEQNVEVDETSTWTPADDTSSSARLDYTESENSLPPNLETRRKKKTGSAMTAREPADTKSTSLLDSRFTRKCGAKRKFSVEDAGPFESAPAEDDGFEFSRPAQSPRLSPQIDHSPVSWKLSPREDTINNIQLKRKVLEPKNTNISFVSPSKPTVTKQSNRQGPSIRRNDENSFQRQGKGGLDRVSPRKPSNFIAVNDAHAPGDNQGAKPDFRAENSPLRDTTHIEVPTIAEVPSTRPSRRRGAVVSYAEPNLRDKMRRSTNELGPAVNEAKSRRSISHTELDRAQHEQSVSAKKSRNSTTAKAEPNLTVNEHAQELEPLNTEDIAMDVDAASITSKRSRRHSSNAKATGRSAQPRFSTNVISVEDACNDFLTANSGGATHKLPIAAEPSANDSHDNIDASSSSLNSTEMTRGQRIAARRRSMML
ncbi:hypothetical protein BDV06DRAFT_218513 [Aspergillus oleicola]